MPLLEPLEDDTEEGQLRREQIINAARAALRAAAVQPSLKRKFTSRVTSRGTSPPPRRRRRPRLATYAGGGNGEPELANTDPSVLEVSDSDDDSGSPRSPLIDLTPWVGAGLQWNDDLPQSVKQARTKARRVPHAAALSMLPDSKITVTELLQLDVPEPDSKHGHAVFTNEPVTPSSFDVTWRESIFSAVPFLPDLRRFFNNAWLSGVTSIKFPHLSAHYPLWVESLLFDVDSYVKKRTYWVRACTWLDRFPLLVDRAQDCLDTFAYIPWDTIVGGLSPAVHLSTADLALFLSNEWLNDDMINAGVDYILQRAGGVAGSSFRILNCLFIQSLRNARAASTEYVPAVFSPIEKAIREGHVNVVWFPLHVSGNHWTLLKINLATTTIAYSDSLRGNLPTEELALVRWWLKALLPADHPDFTIIQPDFPSPEQRDYHSCGIIVLSILAAVLLRYDLPERATWSSEDAAAHRMEWFLRLSLPFADEDLGLDTMDRHTAPTTPEPSSEGDLSLSHLSSPSFAATDEAAMDEAADLLVLDDDEPEVHGLEDVDLCLELPQNLAVEDNIDVDMDSESDFPDHIPLPSPQPKAFCRDSTYYDQSDKDDSDSTSDSDSDSHNSRRRRRPKKSEPKTGSSWAQQKKSNAAAKSADFVPRPSRLNAFRAKVLEDDPKAEFDDNDVRSVRCSYCTQTVIMRTLYDIRRWTEHRATPKCTKARNAGLSTGSLFSMGFKKMPARDSTRTLPFVSPPKIRLLPCPGLTRESNEDIAKYMARTTAPGGGAPSRARIIKDLFSDNITWRDLDPSDQRMVQRREITLYRWKVARNVGAIFAADCLRDVSTPDGKEPEPCSSCRKILKLHTFQVAIHRPMPDELKMKFVPKAHQDPELGKLYLKFYGVRELVELDDGRSPFLKFAQGCADGTYQSDTLTGMVKAIVIKQSRVQKGKSLKNMRYEAVFDQFCDLLASISTRAYLTFQKHFGGRGVRSMRNIRSKVPGFRPGISALNVGRAAEFLNKLGYKGPLALSWDDTALEAAISIHSESKDVCLILGATQGVIRVTEKDDLDDLFEKAQLQKADKVWDFLSIPLPKIPPILIAAVARGSKTKAEELVDMHRELANLLHEHNIHPVSLSSDGAEVERAAQRIIAAEAPSFRVYAIPNSKPGCSIVLKIPIYFGYHPTIITQDSKHGLKTARNQLMTGARLIVIGFFTIVFSMLRNLAFNILGPLFTSDVEKVDKQDDRAAARLFSAATLGFLFNNSGPEQIGLTIYLFVLGELIDAWQNRSIPHRDRAKMVLRARFFLMAWRSHIMAHPDHSASIQFISRESYDIFLTICDGLLSLILVYRNFFPTYPLLPWLHSTEVCEHLFGMLRQLKKDFNYADVLNFERKLRAFMRGSFANLSPDEQANQTSAGYLHTYFTADDLDTAELMRYPTDQELADASEYAFAEAEQLLKLVGIDAQAVLKGYVDPKLSTTFAEPKGRSIPKSKPPQTLLELLALYDKVPFKSSKDEETFETCELALAAESLDKSLAIDALPDSTEDSVGEMRAEIEAHLEPMLPLPFDSALPLVVDNALDIDLLVAERLRHQTKSMAKAVRQRGRSSTVMAARNAGTEDGPSLRESLLKRLAAAVPASDTFNKTTGVDRYVRHAGTFGGSEVPGAATKRAENKATVQAVAASKFVQLRAAAFAPLQFLHPNMHSANITILNPLKPGHLVSAMKPSGIPSRPEIIVGEVVTMYTKNTNHDWIPQTTSVGTPSCVYVLVYKQVGGPLFTSMSCATLACPTYLQIPRSHLLFSLASFTGIDRQAITSAGHPLTLLTLCADSFSLLLSLHERRQVLQGCVLDLSKKAKSKQVELVMDVDVDASASESELDT
ncbi:hypothetical protein C8R43DRAFT_1083442 [Mycena crocata]|nr:hypothetical protein C8R43DRAFT_1083442 [Mycena crocata]